MTNSTEKITIALAGTWHLPNKEHPNELGEPIVITQETLEVLQKDFNQRAKTGILAGLMEVQSNDLYYIPYP